MPISKGYKKEYLVTGETGASLNNAEIKKESIDTIEKASLH